MAKSRIILPIIGIVLIVGLIGLFVVFSKPNGTVLQSFVTPSPEVSSGEMLRQLRATEDAALNTYGWVDRSNGVVHIPIQHAIDLVLERGLPTRPNQ